MPLGIPIWRHWGVPIWASRKILCEIIRRPVGSFLSQLFRRGYQSSCGSFSPDTADHLSSRESLKTLLHKNSSHNAIPRHTIDDIWYCVKYTLNFLILINQICANWFYFEKELEIRLKIIICSTVCSLCKLNQDNPICQCGRKKGRNQASVHDEETTSRDARTALQSSYQDLEQANFREYF